MTPTSATINANDGGVFVPRHFIQLCGNDHAVAMMLAQLVYWSKRTTDPDGWIYKTPEDWKTELGLTRHQVLKGNKILQRIGVEVKTRQISGTPKTNYRITIRLSENRTMDHDEITAPQSDCLKIEQSDYSKFRQSTIRNSDNGLSEIQTIHDKETKTTNKDYIHDPADVRTSAHAAPVENSQTELPIEQPPVAERKPVRARKAKEPNDHQRLMAAYQEALGYPIPNGAQEGTAAAWLLNNGYTIEHIIACYQAKKRDEFWQGKHLSLQSLRKDIGPYVASLKQAQARASPALGPPVSHYAPDARSQAETIRNMQSYLKSNGVVKHDPGITE